MAMADHDIHSTGGDWAGAGDWAGVIRLRADAVSVGGVVPSGVLLDAGDRVAPSCGGVMARVAKTWQVVTLGNTGGNDLVRGG